jgi:hypothetical protein
LRKGIILKFIFFFISFLWARGQRKKLTRKCGTTFAHFNVFIYLVRLLLMYGKFIFFSNLNGAISVVNFHTISSRAVCAVVYSLANNFAELVNVIEENFFICHVVMYNVL